MRAAAYIRVSKEKDGQISPDSQRNEILAYCDRKGWTVTEVFQDIDISGRTDQRPGLQSMLARAQDGEFDAVVFYRIDRLSREPMHHYAILASLKEANVEVDSVNLPSDDTPENAFMWDLSAALAKLESLRLGKRLRSMHRELARQGKYGGNFAPFGWQRIRDKDGQQRLVIDPVEAEHRRRMHEWVVRGWSLQRITDALNSAGVQSRRKTPWRPSTVRKALLAEVQMGARVVDGEEIVTGRIEPLITREEFERTKAILAARQRWPERKSNRALRGNLVRCGGCGRAMYLQHGKSRTVYRCEHWRTCGHGASIREHILSEYVETELLKRLAHLRPPQKREKPSVDITSLLAQEKAATDALGRLVALYASGEISEEEWTSGRAAANKRLEVAKAKLERARSELVRGVDVQEWETLSGVTREVWERLNPDERHEIMRAIIDYVEVNQVGNPPRIRVFWR